VVGSTVIYGPTNKSGAFIRRYNADGSADNTFSGDGAIITAPISDPIDGYMSVLIDSAGKIVVGGSGNLLLERLNANGSLDTTFADGGHLRRSISHANDMQFDADGNILIAGGY